MSQTRPCVECHELDFVRLYTYCTYISPSLAPESSSPRRTHEPDSYVYGHLKTSWSMTTSSSPICGQTGIPPTSLPAALNRAYIVLFCDIMLTKVQLAASWSVRPLHGEALTAQAKCGTHPVASVWCKQKCAVWMNIKIITQLYCLLHEGLKPRHSAEKQFYFKGYESNQRQFRDSPNPRSATVFGIMGHFVFATDRVM
jgi:hypothetical protein